MKHKNKKRIFSKTKMQQRIDDDDVNDDDYDDDGRTE